MLYINHHFSKFFVFHYFVHFNDHYISSVFIIETYTQASCYCGINGVATDGREMLVNCAKSIICIFSTAIHVHGSRHHLLVTGYKLLLCVSCTDNLDPCWKIALVGCNNFSEKKKLFYTKIFIFLTFHIQLKACLDS